MPFLLDKVCSTNVASFVTSYSTALGCSEKSFFFPLLTCTAACMGTDCYVDLSSLWHEPPIIWTLVITPHSLVRVDVAEHLKQEVLKVQNEVWVLSQEEDSKDHMKKFVFDFICLEQLYDMLKVSDGHGFGIYNSIRSLHKCMVSPEDTDIMHRLHYGLSWFTDSRMTRGVLTKTRVNMSVISTPPVVQQTLNTAPSFEELFYQCFLTVCAEESQVKFSQISTTPESEKLREIFHSVIKLHSAGSIIYKLSDEAKEKFGQIHDELTDKAKQLVRKNLEHKVYQPALSYLGRLSCILHVLDNIIESINDKVPISPSTWNTEISAATVWYAREILGHTVEQRHALIEPTNIVSTQKVTPVNVGDRQPSSPRIQRTPQAVNRSPVISPHGSPVIIQNSVRGRGSPGMGHGSPGIARGNPGVVRGNPVIARGNLLPGARNYVNMGNYSRQPRGAMAVRRNLMSNIVNQPNQTTDRFDVLRNQNNHAMEITPCITSVSSAGIPVPNKQVVNRNSNNSTSNISGLSLPSAISVSVSDDAQSSPAVLLSRKPFVSVLDIQDDDFLKSHKSSVKRVLVHNVSQISPSRCVQLKLICDPTAADDSQKYSLSFARTFLKKLERMGFGICEGPKNGNQRHFLFVKKKFSVLSSKQIKILSNLDINEREYNKCFNVAVQKNAQNGGLVCLE